MLSGTLTFAGNVFKTTKHAHHYSTPRFSDNLSNYMKSSNEFRTLIMYLPFPCSDLTKKEKKGGKT
jgi:hypothetical protein